VGEALLEQGLTLFLGDEVTPGLGTRLSPGMQIYIQRSLPVVIMTDGRLIKTRTRRETVGEVLAQEGVALMGQDFSRPSADQAVAADDMIEVVRVYEETEIEEEFISFETEWIPDPEMEIDQQQKRQVGVSGVIKSRTRVRYENGQEVLRALEDEWVDHEPSKQVIAYGTNIVIRTLDTATGPLEYWRKISMLTTPYNAATSGKSADHPQYGITRTGLRVGYGMAAVDPKVIPLMTKIYVPDYGVALAADTGGLILGKHIDLAYDDDQALPDLYGWRDVYILTPIPPADRIRYVLPQWPPQ
jgi:3D (Asp-Asp-Asp) domain-containing protein